MQYLPELSDGSRLEDNINRVRFWLQSGRNQRQIYPHADVSYEVAAACQSEAFQNAQSAGCSHSRGY
ncbi:MAG: hypothetical protein ACI87W_002255 [Halieaceae bacterium]|jgi:hypothetical protein